MAVAALLLVVSVYVNFRTIGKRQLFRQAANPAGAQEEQQPRGQG